jgi:excisionase family DNA binding protein
MPGVRGEKLLTASDLAALCEVDLKTIHNWVDRGRIAHFRTPGRHLRFRAADVADFLRAWGYTVPREIAKASARSILMVGSKEAFAQAQRTLGEGAVLRHAKHSYDALIYSGADPADAFLVEARVVAAEIDMGGMLEALHRACPDATIAVLSDEAIPLPAFAARIGRNDAQALKTLLVPEVPAAAIPAKAAPVPAAASNTNNTNAPPSAEAPPAPDEARGIAAGGSSR